MTTSEAKPAAAANTDAFRPTLKSLLALAWPIVVARSSQAIVGFCDAVMVAQLGEAALAAATTGGFNTYFLFILPMGTCFIVSSFSSQLLGRGDLKAARRYAWYGLAVALFAGLFLAAGTPLLPTVLSLVDLGDEVQTLMTAYMGIRLFSAGAAVGLEAIGNYYAGLGNTRLPMFAQLLAMALNIFLNWVFIFGNLGAPALGIEGAAWASVGATSIAFLALFAAFLGGVGIPDIENAPTPAEKPAEPLAEGQALAAGDGAPVAAMVEPVGEEAPLPPPSASKWFEFVQLLRFGLPSGLNWFLEMGAFIFFLNVVVAGLGTTGLAAMNSVIQLNSIAFMPAFGIASAGAILVGQALGRKRIDHAKVGTKLAVACACTWQSAVGLSYLLFPDALISVFVSSDVGDAQATAAFLEVGAKMLVLSSAWQLFDAIANTIAESLRAAGDTTFTLWARVVVAWVIFIPLSLAWVTYGDGGAGAAVACLVIYMVALAVILTLRYRGGKWQSISLFGESAG